MNPIRPWIFLNMRDMLSRNHHKVECHINKNKTFQVVIPEILDINPKTWLRPFQRNSTSYLLKMAFFYHGLSLILMYTGSFLATNIILDYEIPQLPVSVSLALSSGLLEEAVFFGIPYYLTGNTFVLLGSGIVWSAFHLFSSGVFSIETLAYGGFLLTIPHIFFSIRTWISQKGWFAILFHSSWNFIFLMIYCTAGWRQCNMITDTHGYSKLGNGYISRHHPLSCISK